MVHSGVMGQDRSAIEAINANQHSGSHRQPTFDKGAKG